MAEQRFQRRDEAQENRLPAQVRVDGAEHPFVVGQRPAVCLEGVRWQLRLHENSRTGRPARHRLFPARDTAGLRLVRQSRRPPTESPPRGRRSDSRSSSRRISCPGPKQRPGMSGQHGNDHPAHVVAKKRQHRITWREVLARSDSNVADDARMRRFEPTAPRDGSRASWRSARSVVNDERAAWSAGSRRNLIICRSNSRFNRSSSAARSARYNVTSTAPAATRWPGWTSTARDGARGQVPSRAFGPRRGRQPGRWHTR